MNEKFSTIKAEVKAAFEAYLTANGSVRERAKAHGEALVRLKATCAEQKFHFVDTLKELGVVVSTAYLHLSLVACWDQAQDMARTMGVQFEALCISEVIGLVRGPRKPKKAAPPTVETPDAQAPTTAGGSAHSGGDDFYSVDAVAPQAEAGVQPATDPAGPTPSPENPKRRPNRTDEALEAAIRAHLGTLFNREVRVIYPKGDQTVEVELGHDLVVIVPVK